MSTTTNVFHTPPYLAGTSQLDGVHPTRIEPTRVALNTMFWAGILVTINFAIADFSLSYPVGAVMLFVGIARMDRSFGLGAFRTPLYLCAALTATIVAIGYGVPDAMALTTADDSPARVHESALHMSALLGAFVLSKAMLRFTDGHLGFAWGRWKAAQWLLAAGMVLSALVALLTLTDMPASVTESSATAVLAVLDVLIAIGAGVMTLLALRTTRFEALHGH